MNSSRDSSGSIRPYCTVAAGDDRDAVQRHLLDGHHRAAPSLLPVRLAVRALDQVLGERLDPFRLDLRALTRANRREVSTSSAAITHAGCLAYSADPGKIANLAPRAPRYSPRSRRVLLLSACLDHVLHADVRQQAGEQRGVDADRVLARARVQRDVDAASRAVRSCATMSCHSRMRR